MADDIPAPPTINDLDQILDDMWTNWQLPISEIWWSAEPEPAPGKRAALARLMFQITRIQWFGQHGWTLSVLNREILLNVRDKDDD